MDFSQRELSKLQKLITIYQKTKAIILYSEGVDPNSNSDIQPIKELRDAFDHLMRVMADKYGEDKKDNKNETSIVTDNLEKALGHVYRAAFDALDGTVISLEEEIIKKLNEYPLDVLTQVFPDYYEMKAKLFEIKEKVATFRGNKDVSGNISRVFDEYIREVETLKGTYKKVLDKGKVLDECFNDYKDKEKKSNEKVEIEHKAQYSIQLKAGIVGGVIVGLILLIITNFQTILIWFNGLSTILKKP